MIGGGVLVTIGVVAACLMTACGGGASAAHSTVTIRYSQFEGDAIVARVGVPLTITLVNDDPIEHEWIVGPEAVHARHRTGTEPFHDERPTEVTIPALETRVTTVTFDAPGVYSYICHLPGHEAYGMTGTLRVLAN
jgi:plastocyanin